ncbi:hypothetical protein ABT301_29270 [Streptomyces sp. NPDC000987]|uniref:hypothetical protein n=1 Tax=Streptomyces sp. NPDC000987 TaxID=3154374 RepID=UPI0033278E91
MNTHRHYARGLAAGALCLAVTSITVAVRSTAVSRHGHGGYLLPMVFAYGAVVLAWAAARERAADRRTALEQLGQAAVEGAIAGLNAGHARRADTNGDI